MKIGGVEGGDSAPAARATPRHQYIAPKQMPLTAVWGGREIFFSGADGVLVLAIMDYDGHRH
jgi:hypothetical protein